MHVDAIQEIPAGPVNVALALEPELMLRVLQTAPRYAVLETCILTLTAHAWTAPRRMQWSKEVVAVCRHAHSLANTCQCQNEARSGEIEEDRSRPGWPRETEVAGLGNTRAGTAGGRVDDVPRWRLAVGPSVRRSHCP